MWAEIFMRNITNSYTQAYRSTAIYGLGRNFPFSILFFWQSSSDLSEVRPTKKNKKWTAKATRLLQKTAENARQHSRPNGQQSSARASQFGSIDSHNGKTCSQSVLTIITASYNRLKHGDGPGRKKNNIIKDSYGCWPSIIKSLALFFLLPAEKWAEQSQQLPGPFINF